MDVINDDFIHNKFGYCYYEIEPGKNPIIFNLYVHPEYRRKGHAKQILEYVIGQIRATGYRGVIDIEAIPREQSIDRQSLSNFYTLIGLNVLGERKPKKPGAFDYKDCKSFADALRGRHTTSGPWWATLLRFVPMFDEITFLREKIQSLASHYYELCCVSGMVSPEFDDLVAELKADGHIDAIQ
jgi:hypothetical protein